MVDESQESSSGRGDDIPLDSPPLLQYMGEPPLFHEGFLDGLDCGWAHIGSPCCCSYCCHYSPCPPQQGDTVAMPLDTALQSALRCYGLHDRRRSQRASAVAVPLVEAAFQSVLRCDGWIIQRNQRASRDTLLVRRKAVVNRYFHQQKSMEE
jgi:hypothetical protein